METVQLMITCLADTFFPQVGESMVRVLERSGVRVEFPNQQTCCGQPAFNAGLRQEALPLAKHTIQTFEAVKGEVVIPSGSCTVMLRQGYLELFQDDPTWLGRAQALAERCFEFSEFLVDRLGVADLCARWDGRLSYHPSCHLLRGLGVDRQPRLLLSHVAGADIVELPHADECCGFGGVFSVEHPELSAEMLKRKLANLDETGASTLVVCDSGCLMHIQGGLMRNKKTQRVVHLAQVLDNVGACWK